MLNNPGGGSWCVVENFNAIRHKSKRHNIVVVESYVEDAPFNSFINDYDPVDFPLCGRYFTWYRGDGRVMSRLDKFLVTEEWCDTWTNCTMWALPRGLSNHCSLMLNIDVLDWGSRPQRMLKC